MQGPASSQYRYHSLDLWRGIACLMVIIYHAAFHGFVHSAPGSRAAGWAMEIASRGWVGVPLFFVISGYCIAASADAARRNNYSVRDYFWRRVRRIFPPFWCFLAFAALILWATDQTALDITFQGQGNHHPRLLSAIDWVGNATLTWTWIWHATGAPPHQLQSHTWSLCYEEQFYAVVGLLLLVARNWIWGAAVLITYAAIAAYTALQRMGLNIDGFFFDGSWVAFSAGISVYWFRNCGLDRKAATGIALCLPVLAWILRHPRALLVNGHVHSQEVSLLVAALFAAALIIMSPFDSKIACWRASQPLACCGRMCYSLYLVHLPITYSIANGLYARGYSSQDDVLLFSVPACVAASILVALPFHIMIERRFMNQTCRDLGKRSAELLERSSRCIA